MSVLHASHADVDSASAARLSSFAKLCFFFFCSCAVNQTGGRLVQSGGTPVIYTQKNGFASQPFLISLYQHDI